MGGMAMNTRSINGFIVVLMISAAILFPSASYSTPHRDGFAGIQCVEMSGDEERTLSFNGTWYLSGGANRWKIVLKQNGNRVWGTIYTKDVYRSEAAVGRVEASVVSADGLALEGTWYWDYDPDRKIGGLGENHSTDRLELSLKLTHSNRIIIRGVRLDPPYQTGGIGDLGLQSGDGRLPLQFAMARHAGI
jgi:hypothetical protein